MKHRILLLLLAATVVMFGCEQKKTPDYDVMEPAAAVQI